MRFEAKSREKKTITDSRIEIPLFVLFSLKFTDMFYAFLGENRFVNSGSTRANNKPICLHQ